MASYYFPLTNYSVQSIPSTEEKVKIIKALESVNYNKGIAAKKLGISRTTLWRKLKDLNIN